jgi:hypothetical protein
MVDAAGNVYVTDSFTPFNDTPEFSGNSLLRKISPAGVVTTLAGQAGVAGNVDGSGSSARFYNSVGLASNSAGAIYVSDAGNNTIRLAAFLPAVAVTATQPNASVPNGVAGQFTVTRTGGTQTSLTLTYTLAGTAVNGTDYSLPGTVTIPIGASSATIPLYPMRDLNAASTTTVQLTLSGPTTSVMIDTTPATVTITELSPSSVTTFGSWETAHSISTSSSQTASNFSDGVANYLKYVFDINPLQTISTADRAAMPAAGQTTVGANTYLTLTYRQSLLASGFTVHVQTSPDLITWTTATPPDLSNEVGIDPTTHDPIMQVGTLVPADATKRYIRLEVTQP